MTTRTLAANRRMQLKSRTIHEVEHVASIPSMERATYALCVVTDGRREWRVLDYGGNDYVVKATWLGLDRSMRSCGLRQKIMQAARS